MKHSSTSVDENDWWKGTWEFWDVGRNKGRATTTPKEPEDLLAAIRPFIMSSDVSLDYDWEKNEGTVFVGMFRAVGKFKKVVL